MLPYQEFIHKSRYARWIESESRRETWQETVQRYVDFMVEHCRDVLGAPLDDSVVEEVYSAILNLEVLPSMRALMTAGPALRKENVAGYNCAFIGVDDTKAFDEIMYILMNGTGVGFSVEDRFISKLPAVAEEFYKSDSVIVVKDSRIGWASAYREFISLLYAGKIPSWDVSKLRPKGAKLKTMGGRSSGPEPLVDLFKYTIRVFRKAAGRKLTSVECHDIICKTGDIVVVGGVRRSALISLSDLGDDRMRTAKSGQWWDLTPERRLANNSAVYTDKPDIGTFMREWMALYESKSGERGIFNRNITVPERRRKDVTFGTNPCGEIILRSAQFCNLSEVVVRPDDTEQDLYRKVRIASIIGTFQSSLTNFKYLRKVWRQNVEEERLLGVSMTGIMDNDLLNGTHKHRLAFLLEGLKEKAISTNVEFAEKLGINPSVAVTCVKPSGTTSQLTLTSSGIHPSWSRRYIRRVRLSLSDPLCVFMGSQGVPFEQDKFSDNTMIFEFPIAVADTSKTKNEISAMDQLKLYLTYKEHWAEHNISNTVYVAEHEWIEIAAWVYDHFDDIGGISFLPKDENDHTYVQAPYEEITEDKFNELTSTMPTVLDWGSFVETEDVTTGTQELACVSGSCEIV